MVRHQTHVIGTVILLFALGSVHGAWAGPPTDQLRDGVDRVFKILKDPELEGARNTNQRRTAITKVAGEMFDFGEMAKRSLGPHWEQRTPAERAEFVGLFTELIQRSYMSKVDQHGSAGSMTFRGETVDGDHAVVQTTIPLRQGSAMPLEYRMLNTAGRWRVYDLSIDGISLVGNYRAQFNKVIRSESYAALVARFKSLRGEFSEPAAAASGRKSAL